MAGEQEYHREFVGGDGRTWSDETGSWEVGAGKLTPPEDGGVWLDATSWELLCQYATAKESARMWTDMAREAKDALIKILGTAEHGHYGGERVVSIVRTRPMRFNQSAFAEANPGLWDQFREAPDEDEVRLSIPKSVKLPSPAPTKDTA